MKTTPQERLALGTAALLLVLGVGARTLRPDAPPPEWSGVAADSGAALDRQIAAVERETARERRRNEPLAPGERLDPNTAGADELARLPRVGEDLARRIVEHRTARGPFRTLADLDSVAGVGPALLAQAAPHLALAPAPAAVSSFAARGAVTPGAPRASATGPVDLNRATAAELEALPGVGPALAARIVAHRQRNGPFRSAEGLDEVSGIGPSTLARLRPLVTATP